MDPAATQQVVGPCNDWSPLIVPLSGLLSALAAVAASYAAIKGYELKERIRSVQRKVGADRRPEDR